MGFPNKQTHRGTGFLIANKIKSRVSIKEVEVNNPNIGWIQYIERKQTMYIAIVYVPFSEKEKAPEILNTLRCNVEELSLTGSPIIMGDFNIRNSRTGDKPPKGDSTNHKNNKALEKFLDKTEYLIASDQELINENKHWTFSGPRGGTSVPDYILIPRAMKADVAGYRVSWETHCDSYHAMQNIQVQVSIKTEHAFWSKAHTPRKEWNEANIAKFKDCLKEIGDEPILRIEELHAASTKLLQDILQAQDASMNTAKHNKRKRTQATPLTKEENNLRTLQQKATLLTTLHNRAKTGVSKDLWSKIHEINNQIHSTSLYIYKSTHQWWWKALAALNPTHASADFWKIAKRLRKQKDSEPFPSALELPEGIIHTKKEIKHAIAKYFKEVSEGKDLEAITFRSQVPHPPAAHIRLPPPTSNRIMHITMQELDDAIQSRESHKAGGPDGTTAESFKNLSTQAKTRLLSIMNAAANLDTTPAKWQEYVVKLIHKKGSIMQIPNYRPISLLNSILKIWEGILYQRLLMDPGVISALSTCQYGSQRGKGATDAVLAINLLKEDNLAEDFYSAHIDLSKAYNRINRNKLWLKLHKLQIPPELISLIRSTFSAHEETYQLGGDKTKPQKHHKNTQMG